MFDCKFLVIGTNFTKDFFQNIFISAKYHPSYNYISCKYKIQILNMKKDLKFCIPFFDTTT